EFAEKWGEDRRTRSAFYQIRSNARKFGMEVTPSPWSVSSINTATIPDPAPAHAKEDPSLEDLEELFTSLENADEIRHRISPTEQVISYQTPDNKPFGVAFMSDIHAGASGVDYARFRYDLEVIR